jgi:hypothetical protein
MKPLRTIPWFIRLLAGLFLVAQCAGMVSPPHANALPLTAAAVAYMDVSTTDASMAAPHHVHVQGHGDHGTPCSHHDHGGSTADAGCALHACCTGLLPPIVAIATDPVAGEPLAMSPDGLVPRTASGRLDRPPRPLH